MPVRHQRRPGPRTSSGTWSLSGQALHITLDHTDGTFGSPEGTASSVPLVVSGDASARFNWQYAERPSDIQANYNARGQTLTILRKTGRITQTMTAVRS